MGRGKLVLITGGARSGKSGFAEEMAMSLSGDVTYIATAEALDEEMKDRIRHHRERRPQHWQTVEEPRRVAEAIAEVGQTAPVILLDCLTLLCCNLLLEKGRFEGEQFFIAPEEESRILAYLKEMAGVAREVPAHVIIVANEIGLGLVPPYELGRAYRDLAGWANQAVAEAADEVYFTIAGLPIEIRELGMQTRRRFQTGKDGL